MVSRRLSSALLSFLPVTVLFAGCERGEEPLGPSSTTRVVSTSESAGRDALVATISTLEHVDARASVPQQTLLTELRGMLARIDAPERARPGFAAVYGSPYPSGASWIWVNQGLFREVHYKAYTTCNDCYSGDVPYGQMQVRQYAGTVLTLSTSRLFGGYPGYVEGDVTTTISGAAQSGVVYTDHWIDVWLGTDPHFQSSASAQV